MTLIFNTERLSVNELMLNKSERMNKELLSGICSILTVPVVKRLPPYFHDVHDQASAIIWLDKMLSDSKLFMISLKGDVLPIGFIFASKEEEYLTHIGYLLAQPYWGKGLAFEMLSGFIEQVKVNTKWEVLLAGVEQNNVASIKLLSKLGFKKQKHCQGNASFYQLRINRL